MVNKKTNTKNIIVKVPVDEVVRVRRHEENPRKFIIDFRGIRSNSTICEKVFAGNKCTFTDPAHLESRIEEYFTSCFGPLLDKKWNPVRNADGEIVRVRKKPYTVTGLCLYIGCTRETLLRYEDGKFDTPTKNFSGIIKKAKMQIEMFAEERLYDKDSYNGARFVLDASFGWKTQREAAEILERLKLLELKREELELKKKMMELEGEEDGNINIVISKKESRVGE